MPENFYWYYDNFFYKVTNMESPRKNNDCYFYYYSTCTKGDSCTFRHEPSALGCETVCSFWKEGKCVNAHCNFRHMELRKNRKAIPCYWEAKPGGCLKPHCPFFHKSNRDSSSDSLGSAELQSSDISKTLGQSTSQSSDCDRLMVQFNETNYGNPVDPLVVNFEEESDNESASTISPSKVNQSRTVKVKTLEEIRLEKIQAESAAYYSYPGVQETTDGTALEDANDLRTRIMKRLNIKMDEAPDMKDFQVLSLDEIRKRKKRKTEYKSLFEDNMEEDLDKTNDAKKQRVILNKNVADNLSTVKVKSLAEIRAEKLSKADTNNLSSNKRKLGDSDVLTTCPEVSSTSNTEELLETREHCTSEEMPAKRLRRKVSSSTDEIISNKPKLFRDKQEQVFESYLPESMDENIDKPDFGEDDNNDSSNKKQTSVEVEFKRETSKIDDILLFDEEDLEDSNINFKAEEEIFKDIDNLLND